MARPRICIVPEFPQSLMTGGTLVQAVETRRALAQHITEMDFELFNWSDKIPPADCYHFIGLPKYLAGVPRLIAQAGRPYVLTLLLGSMNRRARCVSALRRRLAFLLNWNREHQRAIRGAAAHITITQADADNAALIYGLRREQIHIVPVAVTEVFLTAQPFLWQSTYGSEPFVLSVGALQPRKNQLLLAQVCNALKLPMVMVGGVLAGHDDYASLVEREMQINGKFGGRWFQCDDPMLASAYAACRLFVLFSSSETQPASVLQAMAVKKPVLLADAPYAREHPFDILPKAVLTSRDSITQALQKAWSLGSGTELPSEFTWAAVSKKLNSIYCDALRRKLARKSLG